MLAAIILAAVMVSTPERAQAAKAGTCAGYTVRNAANPAQTFTATIPAAQVPARLFVDGTFTEFEVRTSDFAVFNYRHTGATSVRPDKDLPVPPGGVTIFDSKIPTLRNGSAPVLTGALSLVLSNEGVVLERSGGGQDLKIQAKDCVQGGLFQMEPEPGLIETNTLGDGFVYTGQPPGETRLCFTNGAVPGYDSPQFANLLRFDSKTAVWDVVGQGDVGGRIGMVIGEDAVEGGCNP